MLSVLPKEIDARIESGCLGFEPQAAFYKKQARFDNGNMQL